jgi:hypothetical protein
MPAYNNTVKGTVMKPRLIIRYAVMIFVASTIMFFLESYRQQHKINRNVDKGLITDVEVKVSNNDFILFESVSKYLFINLSK